MEFYRVKNVFKGVLNYKNVNAIELVALGGAC